MGGPAISRHGIYPGDYLHTAPGSNDVNSAASVNQYLQLTDNQTCSWDIVVVCTLFLVPSISGPHNSSQPQVPTTEAQVPSELPSTYSFETSQPDEMPNPSISSVEWNDATIDSLYTSQHQPMPDFGPLSQWDTQYPDYSQFPTSFSSIDNSVNAAQTTPFQADLGSYYPPSYVEQYLLDIEAREDDGLSIHVRIPPSIPGAMYYGTHLMSEFSQEADGTIDVRVHLPAGYARISSTFVHA